MEPIWRHLSQAALEEGSLGKPLYRNSLPFHLGCFCCLDSLVVPLGKAWRFPLGSKVLPVVTSAVFFSPFSSGNICLTNFIPFILLWRPVSTIMAHRQKITSTITAFLTWHRLTYMSLFYRLSLVCLLVHPTLHFQYPPELPPQNGWASRIRAFCLAPDWQSTLHKDYTRLEGLHIQRPQHLFLLPAQGLRQTLPLRVYVIFLSSSEPDFTEIAFASEGLPSLSHHLEDWLFHPSPTLSLWKSLLQAL